MTILTRLWITDAMGGNPIVESLVKLPDWECEQCILQWTYRNGENTYLMLAWGPGYSYVFGPFFHN